MPRENFKIKAERQYKKSLNDILKNFAEKGLNYDNLATETGFTITTVHKWCRRYKINLDRYSVRNMDEQDYYVCLKDFSSSKINRTNCLSRIWM